MTSATNPTAALVALGRDVLVLGAVGPFTFLAGGLLYALLRNGGSAGAPLPLVATLAACTAYGCLTLLVRYRWASPWKALVMAIPVAAVESTVGLWLKVGPAGYSF